MNNRLKQFLAAENISQSQFADTIGVARASISHILSGRNKPGFEFFTSIARHYPSLNLTWLITGKGRMYGNGSSSGTLVAVPSAATADSSEETQEVLLDGEASSGGDLFSGELSGQEKLEYDRIPVSNESRPRAQERHMQPEDDIRNISAPAMPGGGYTSPQVRRITKVVVFYDDNTYQEIK